MMMLEVKNFLMVYQALMKTGIGSLRKPEVVQSPPAIFGLLNPIDPLLNPRGPPSGEHGNTWLLPPNEVMCFFLALVVLL